MDDDGNRKLDFDEFKKGLHDYGLTVSDEDARGMFSQFDQDGNGSIDFTEFLNNLRVSAFSHYFFYCIDYYKNLEKLKTKTKTNKTQRRIQKTNIKCCRNSRIWNFFFFFTYFYFFIYFLWGCVCEVLNYVNEDDNGTTKILKK